MADLWAAFPDAPQDGPVKRPNSGDAWAAFPDAQPAPPERSTAERSARLGGQFAQNANDAIVNTLTSPGDLIGDALKWAGVANKDAPSFSSAYRQAVDDVAGLPLRVRDAWKQGSLDPIFAPRDAYQTRFDPENREEKIAAGVGQGVGTVAATLMPAGAIANAARPGTVTQGVAQTMATQPGTQLASGVAGGAVTGATDDPLLGAAAALATPLAASVARGAISPTTVRLTPQEQRLAAAATREGIPLTPAQQTGSPTLRTIEETMAKLPLSSGPMQNTYRGQREAFNRAALQRAGVDATEASPDTLNRAFQAAGQTFDDLAARTTLNVDNQFVGDVQRVAQDYGRRLETNVAGIFQSYMDDLQPLLQAATSGQNPQIAGQVYGRIRSDIGRTIRANARNPDLQRALGALQGALDDVVERSASGALRNEWQEARRQYQALTTIDKAMQGGTQANRSNADIPFSALRSAVAGGDRAGFSRGRGQLNELSRVGDFLADRVPDSGTPARGMAANLLTGGALFGGASTLGAGLATAAGAAAAPWAASRLYNTPAARAYLTNQVAGNTDFAGLYGAEALRRAIEEGRGGGEPSALARALMRANEQRAAR